MRVGESGRRNPGCGVMPREEEEEGEEDEALERIIVALRKYYKCKYAFIVFVWLENSDPGDNVII